MHLNQGMPYVLSMLHQALAPVEPELVEHDYAAVGERLSTFTSLYDVGGYIESMDTTDRRKLCNVAIYLLYLRRRLLGGPPE